jgi:hypothetical protein
LVHTRKYHSKDQPNVWYMFQQYLLQCDTFFNPQFNICIILEWFHFPPHCIMIQSVRRTAEADENQKIHWVNVLHSSDESREMNAMFFFWFWLQLWFTAAGYRYLETGRINIQDFRAMMRMKKEIVRNGNDSQ